MGGSVVICQKTFRRKIIRFKGLAKKPAEQSLLFGRKRFCCFYIKTVFCFYVVYLRRDILSCKGRSSPALRHVTAGFLYLYINDTFSPLSLSCFAKYPFEYIINVPEVVLKVEYILDLFLGKIFSDVPVFHEAGS